MHYPVAAIMAAVSGSAEEAAMEAVPGIKEALELHGNLGNLSARLLTAGFVAALE